MLYDPAEQEHECIPSDLCHVERNSPHKDPEDHAVQDQVSGCQLHISRNDYYSPVRNTRRQLFHSLYTALEHSCKQISRVNFKGIADFLLIPQRVDRIRLCGLRCRIDSKENSDNRRNDTARMMIPSAGYDRESKRGTSRRHNGHGKYDADDPA